ncbi:hypothetical protein IV498_11820 [Paenarthrobacter sp. Z7-10]|uniref:hypothetical protein n=1 Tax=Paenarthrobacter sp. Z7-10 TaxID=2787635 RepID=UPI0022A98D13|nr:hypothetical protein [Paenarthrobacter sp. Z7-10]MCZ2403851.1 hypothetical protein [Paenarthrobacter sp. Z7-10]
MGFEWAASAAKHGIAREDALNAMLNAVDFVESFDDPRMPGRGRPNLYIGPSRDRRRLIEVMVEVIPPSDVSVFHVMEARRKILDLVEELRGK